VDLKIRPTVAAICGALIAMLIGPAEAQHALIIQNMFARVIKAEIYEKPGRSYPRRGRKKKGGKKGNAKAQYRRRKQRKAQKRTKPG